MLIRLAKHSEVSIVSQWQFNPVEERLIPFSSPKPPIFLNCLALFAQEFGTLASLLRVVSLGCLLRLSAACIQGTQVEVEVKLSRVDRRAPPALLTGRMRSCKLF